MRRKNIFNKPVAMELVRLGHDVLAIHPNKNIEGFYLFTFEDNKQFREDLTKITNKINNK